MCQFKMDYTALKKEKFNMTGERWLSLDGRIPTGILRDAPAGVCGPAW